MLVSFATDVFLELPLPRAAVVVCANIGKQCIELTVQSTHRNFDYLLRLARLGLRLILGVGLLELGRNIPHLLSLCTGNLHQQTLVNSA